MTATVTNRGRTEQVPMGEVPWVPAFLDALLLGKSVKDAAAAAQVSATTVYSRRRTDEDFQSAWDEAITVGTELLEGEAQRRAYHGVDKPVFHKGEVCGHVREYSDALLTRLLEARKPEVYRRDHTVNVQITNAVTAIAVLRESVNRDQLRATLAAAIDIGDHDDSQVVREVSSPATTAIHPPPKSLAPVLRQLAPVTVTRDSVDVGKLRAAVSALGDGPAPVPPLPAPPPDPKNSEPEIGEVA
jgi:hypothetical protein